MVVTRLIERKRDGGDLTAEEWHRIIVAYTRGDVPDYQMAALLMAVVLKGLEPHEFRALVRAMLDSGARLDPLGDGPRVDKHSTGGVGDKVSLILAPLVASCGVAVPMMSGRGLGHTGGTLDKLETIPGFRTDLPLREAREQLDRLGCVLMAATPEIAPADRKLYALRDVTATVPSIPLIAASIMSKKLAEGLTGLVLDIKRGSGAFLPAAEDGLALAGVMIDIGIEHGCDTTALVTAMDRPLGYACGNALEVEESFAVLRGEGPADVREVTMALGVEMLQRAGERDPVVARARLEDAMNAGRAMDKCRQIIEAQGGNPAVADDPAALPQAAECVVVEAPGTGYVATVAPRPLGYALIELGAGRKKMGDPIDGGAGFVITAKPGDHVVAGTPLASVYASKLRVAHEGATAVLDAIRISPDAPESLPLISHRVTRKGVEYLT